MLDLKITGGRIVDGTGAAAYVGDVGVKDGRIVALGVVAEAAHETIEAAGKVVAPGFIDVHTHYDAQAFWDPTFSPSCCHGVTTIFGGFCGFSIAPLTPEAGAYLLPMLARVEGMPVATLKAGVPWDWDSFASFLGRLEGRIALNAGFFVGHSAVRRVVMGARAVGETATPAELAEMRRLVDQSLREGAMGFSTTVSVSHNDADGNPVPSRHASREEILELASAVRDHPGTSLELLPNLDFGEETLALLTDVSLAGQRPVNWNLLVLHGADTANRERIARALHASDYARERGAEVVALTLPCASTVRINFHSGFILDALPGWAPLFRLRPAERIEKLRDPTVRAILETAAATQTGPMGAFTDWKSYRVAEVCSAENKGAQGRLVGEVAAERGVSPFAAMLDLAIEDALLTSFQSRVLGEDAETYALRGQLWQDDRVLVGGSDAGAHMDMIDSFAFSTKLLQRARDYRVMSLEQAVHRITEVPARYFGLRSRGLLKTGYCADVTIFDPDTVACGEVYTRYDLPGAEHDGRLYAEAIGVACVIVNGVPVVRDNQILGARPGTVLKSGRDSETVAMPRTRAA